MLEVEQVTDASASDRTATPGYLRRLKESGRSIVLTINGEVDLVVEDSRSYQKLVEIVERAEELDDLRQSVVEMRAGLVVPAEDVIAELRQLLQEQQGH